MSDADYSPEDIGAYGARAQPAIAARMAPHLRMTQLGAGCALVAVVCSIIALIQFPSFAPEDGGRGWALTAVIAAVAVLAGCVIQVAVWQRALASWRGQLIQDLHGEVRLSWITHLLSYPIVLVALLASIAGSSYASWSAPSATFLAVELLFVLAAQMLAGVQYLRASGPPGTLPAHLRRLMDRTRQDAR